MPFLASEGCFWPLAAFMRLEVKNDHAHVITQGICNKLIEVNFCVGCMVSQPNGLFQHSTTIGTQRMRKLLAYEAACICAQPKNLTGTEHILVL